MAKMQLCTFSVANLQFAVDVLQVQEVFQYQELTHVPLAPHAVVGLINLRGQIVTGLDMRRRLELEPSESEEQPMNVVLRQGDNIISLLVDTIGDVVEVEDDRFEAPPETLDDLTRSVVHSICKLEEQLLLVLDATAVTSKGLHKPS